MKIINIIIIAIISIGITFTTSNVFSSSNDNTSGGAQLTVSDDTSTSDDLKFQPSPGVRMQCETSASQYALNSINESADAGNSFEYLIASSLNNVYQQKVDSIQTLSLNATASELTTAGYSPMGGSTNSTD